MVLPEHEHTIFLFWNKPAERAMIPHASLKNKWNATLNILWVLIELKRDELKEFVAL